MVIFDQLKISDNGKALYITAHVNEAEDAEGRAVFENIYIDSIAITTSDKVSDDHPYCAPKDEDCIYKHVFAEDSRVKDINLVLYPNDMFPFSKSTFTGDLFFVYITCKAVGDATECFHCLPCYMTKETTLGVTFDETLLYQRVLDYTKELANSCETPQGMIDFILLWKAFTAAIETEHFTPAIKFYNMLFGNGTNNKKTDGSHSPYGGYTSSRTGRGCKCHG